MTHGPLNVKHMMHGPLNVKHTMHGPLNVKHTLLLCQYFVTFMYSIDYFHIHMDFVIQQNK